MSEVTIDIVRLVENSPLTILGEVDYQSKLIDKLRSKFSTDEERLFLTSFYTFLNCDSTEFVIELRKIWKWLGFKRNEEAKRLLVNHFQVNKDYKNLAPPKSGAKQHGGHNRENTFLTVRCFKKFCLKARTTEADKIHDYYLNLEESVQELLSEETKILRDQLLIKDKNHEDFKTKSLLDAYDKKPVLYLAYVETGIVKFGYSNDIKDRISRHRQPNTWPIFNLRYVIGTPYNRELENLIKKELKDRIISKSYYGHLHKELIKLDTFYSITKLHKDILKIKETIDTGEIIEKLTNENEQLRNQINEIKYTNNDKLVVKLLNENITLKNKPNVWKGYVCITKKNGYYKLNLTEEPLDCIFCSSNKYIYDLLYILLKPFMISSNTVKIKYEIISKVIEFVRNAYDIYLISSDEENLHNFVNKYKNNYLSSKTRQNIDKEVYEKFINDVIIYDNTKLIPFTVLCDEFYNWFEDKKSLKVNGNWSKLFQNEFMKVIEEITTIKKSRITLPDYKKYQGFAGITTKSFESKKSENTYYQDSIYEKYIKEFITTTHNTNNKVSRNEILLHFSKYTKQKGIYNPDTFKKSYSLKFIKEFMKKIENDTQVSYEPTRTKKRDKGCFVGIVHSEFDCEVNTIAVETCKKHN